MPKSKKDLNKQRIDFLLTFFPPITSENNIYSEIGVNGYTLVRHKVGGSSSCITVSIYKSDTISNLKKNLVSTDSNMPSIEELQKQLDYIQEQLLLIKSSNR